jgi:hypothetical protein
MYSYKYKFISAKIIADIIRHYSGLFSLFPSLGKSLLGFFSASGGFAEEKKGKT